MFFGRRDRRKAAGEGEQLALANPPFRTQTGDNGGHWSICFYLSFFVLFFPHRAPGRCFAFSFARSLRPLSPHLFRHLPGQQFLLFMSQTRREREKEKEEGDFSIFLFFFSPLFIYFIQPSLPLSIALTAFATHAPSSPPPPHSLSTRNFVYFSGSPTVLISSHLRTLISIYSLLYLFLFPISPSSFFLPPSSYASFWGASLF